MYLLPLLCIFKSNPDKFQNAKGRIQLMQSLLVFLAVFGLVCVYNHNVGTPGDWSKFIEWAGFLELFVHMSIVSTIFPCRDFVKYDDE